MTIQETLADCKWSPNVTAFDSWSNYGGDDMSDWYIAYSRNRDSDILTLSNFDCVLELLNGEESGKVEIHNFGHWAVGWIEHILIHSNATKELETLLEIRGSLENYPVLDECDYSNREVQEKLDSIDSWAWSDTCSLIGDTFGPLDFPKRLRTLLYDDFGDFEPTDDCESKLKDIILENLVSESDGQYLRTENLAEEILESFRSFHVSDCQYPCCTNLKLF